MAKTKVDNVLLLMIFLLIIFGLVMITSIGVTKSIDLSNKTNILYPSCNDIGIDCYFLLKRHVRFLGIGILAAFIAAKIHYRFWKKMSVFLFAGAVTLLCLVLVIGSKYTTFATSWISIGGNSFQPIEFAKLSLVFFLAHWMERKGDQIATFQNGFLPFCIVTSMMLIPIVLQPDLGGTLVVAAIAVSMFYAAGARMRDLALGALTAFMIGALVISYSGRVRDRFMAFITPDKSCHEDYCWQSIQANIAVGSGGFWGKGLTQGVQKSNWLPEASGDFIFAASAEELGFVRIFFLVICYAVIGYRGFKIAAAAPNRFAMLTAVGISTWITIQAFVNIAVNLALMPVTGITLPLVSYGGSSVLSIMIASGVLLHISKNTSDYAPSTKRRGNRRPYYSKRSSYSGT